MLQSKQTLRRVIFSAAAVMAAQVAGMNDNASGQTPPAGAKPPGQAPAQPKPKPPGVDWKKLPAPVIDGPFVRPRDAADARPVWGHARGLRVGLHPMPGPRGLLRIYAPYLGHDEGRVINYIAIEPILAAQKRRGFSELEVSQLDAAAGKRFWSADAPGDFAPRRPEQHPARGVVTREGGAAVLRVYVLIEPFAGGARPYVRLTFRSDRPQEVGLATFAQKDSPPLSACIVTATMGNFARLRQMHLAGKTVLAGDLWPDYRDSGFAPHKKWPLAELFRAADGSALVAATPDEIDPQQVKAPFPNPWWRYYGKKATQYWRCERPDAKLVAQVNGRYTFYGGNGAIPGGVAFENFELVEPYREGGEFWFGVAPRTPKELGLASTAIFPLARDLPGMIYQDRATPKRRLLL